LVQARENAVNGFFACKANDKLGFWNFQAYYVLQNFNIEEIVINYHDFK